MSGNASMSSLRKHNNGVINGVIARLDRAIQYAAASRFYR
jgi:hypothetical protein